MKISGQRQLDQFLILYPSRQLNCRNGNLAGSVKEKFVSGRQKISACRTRYFTWKQVKMQLQIRWHNHKKKIQEKTFWLAPNSFFLIYFSMLASFNIVANFWLAFVLHLHAGLTVKGGSRNSFNKYLGTRRGGGGGRRKMKNVYT